MQTSIRECRPEDAAALEERAPTGTSSTAIIRAAERLAARGHHWIGLGVDDRNRRAAALSLRLG